MLEEPKIKKVDKRDKQLPQNFEQLMEMYDIEKIWPYILKMVQSMNNVPNDLNEITENHDNDVKTLTEKHEGDIQKLTENISNLIEQYGLEAVSNFFESASKIMDFNASGKGMAIGKVSEKNALEVDMDMYYKGKYLSALLQNEYLGTGINLNNITTPGQYGIYGTNTNCPTTSIAVLEVVKYTADWILQRITTIEAKPRVYERCYHSGSTWGAWVKEPIYDSGGSLTVDANLVAGWSVKANNGLLQSTHNGNTVQIGSQNAQYCHIYNSANIPFYFNSDIQINGYNVLKRTTIYNNSSGTSGTVTLYLNASSFSYLEIHYKNADGQVGSTTITEPNGKTTYGTIIRKNSGDTAVMINSALFAISGTTITISRNGQANMFFADNDNVADTNSLYITKVYGIN